MAGCVVARTGCNVLGRECTPRVHPQSTDGRLGDRVGRERRQMVP